MLKTLCDIFVFSSGLFSLFVLFAGAFLFMLERRNDLPSWKLRLRGKLYELFG